MKETYKHIADELKKVDEGIDELKDELKDLKAIEGPPAVSEMGPQEAARKAGRPAAITHDDYIFKEEQESVLERECPDIRELVNNPYISKKKH